MIRPDLQREYRDAGLLFVGRPDATSALIEVARCEVSAVVVPTDVVGMTAVDVTEIVRSFTSALVLIALADHTHQEIAVDALRAGARGIVSLPLDAARIAEEIRTLRSLQRAPGPPIDEVVVGDAVLSWSEHRVTVAGVEARLPPKEFEVLGYLLARAPHVVSLRELIDVFEGGDPARARSMRVTIGKIRSRLTQAAPERPSLVRTVHGVGYRTDAGDRGEAAVTNDHPNLPET